MSTWVHSLLLEYSCIINFAYLFKNAQPYSFKMQALDKISYYSIQRIIKFNIKFLICMIVDFENIFWQINSKLKGRVLQT